MYTILTEQEMGKNIKARKFRPKMRFKGGYIIKQGNEIHVMYLCPDAQDGQNF
jgi:hypothetical protein